LPGGNQDLHQLDQSPLESAEAAVCGLTQLREYGVEPVDPLSERALDRLEARRQLVDRVGHVPRPPCEARIDLSHDACLAVTRGFSQRFASTGDARTQQPRAGDRRQV
jgi:hypothetical protein